VIFGPTGVGKSDVVFSLLDPRFEVINADSMQVYRGMDIGTAKPCASDMAALTHHLVSILDPAEQYNAGEFVKRAESIVQSMGARGRHPVICGGTAFYIRSFLFGLPESPRGSAEARMRLRAREKAEGLGALYEELVRKDPSAAGRIMPNDRYRVARALEILESTGRSMFTFHWPRTLRNDYRFLLIGLELPREELYARIDRRVDRMFDDGLRDEVRRLMENGHTGNEPGMQGIGYREFFEMQKGCITLADLKEHVKRDSRRYAKRQVTFFKSIPDVRWVAAEEREMIRRLIEGFIA
jgi:tRNA dimethylallyltransferase